MYLTTLTALKHPHLTPAETWRDLFTTTLSSGSPEEKEAAREMQHTDTMFTPVQTPAHEEILRLLRDNDADTITIIAIGPLTNLARAAATDPEIFLRAKEIVVMGGAISTPGNVACPPSPPFTPLPLIPSKRSR